MATAISNKLNYTSIILLVTKLYSVGCAQVHGTYMIV